MARGTQKHGLNLEDANLSKVIALPAADGTVNTATVDLGAHAAGEMHAEHEVEILCPVLTTTELPNADTMTYELRDSADDSTFIALETGQITALQTGGGGAGAAAIAIRAKLPSTVRRYIRLYATGAGTIGDCSGKNAELRLKF